LNSQLSIRQIVSVVKTVQVVNDVEDVEDAEIVEVVGIAAESRSHKRISVFLFFEIRNPQSKIRNFFSDL
jgi:hypothetical protein